MHIFNSKTDKNWLSKTLNALRIDGYAILENILEKDFIKKTQDAMYGVQKKIHQEIGLDRLREAGELGVLRIMARYDNFFLQYLETSEMLEIIDQTVSPTAVLHLQNGFILPSFSANGTPLVFQNAFHMDFPRYLNNYLASMNAFFTISAFTKENGATLFVPGSHQKPDRPTDEDIRSKTHYAECAAGSLFMFDSTLYHAAGKNISGQDRLSINHQFTRSFLKQQIDYVRALGNDLISIQKPRTQQLLGWYTRIPTSLEDYYRSPEERLYRKGQG